jgi:hypothetical protein
LRPVSKAQAFGTTFAPPRFAIGCARADSFDADPIVGIAADISLWAESHNLSNTALGLLTAFGPTPWVQLSAP